MYNKSATTACSIITIPVMCHSSPHRPPSPFHPDHSMRYSSPSFPRPRPRIITSSPTRIERPDCILAHRPSFSLRTLPPSTPGYHNASVSRNQHHLPAVASRIEAAVKMRMGRTLMVPEDVVLSSLTPHQITYPPTIAYLLPISHLSRHQ